MDFKKSKHFLLVLGAIYWALVLMVYVVAGDQFHHTVVTGDTLSPASVIGEIGEGMRVEQRLIAPAESIVSVDVDAATFGRVNAGVMNLSLENENGEEVARGSVDVSMLADGQYTTIPVEQTAEINRSEALTLVLTAQGASSGNAVSIYYGNVVTAGRFDIAQNIAPEDLYVVNGSAGAGRLCVRLNGVRALSFYKAYWGIVTGVFAVLAVYAVRGYKLAKKGKNSGVAAICTLYTKYGFLLHQLVSRDFKTKYKRSVLGMAWSFLNPLLTMGVQYIVFSTLFRSNIANYPVYLLSGIVLFNFFNEAVSMGMTSITGNASLIKKVYMPKYIYPVARICSSLINFVLAIIPLFLVMLLTGTAFKPSLLLLVFDLLCLLGFVTGMGLLMATAMTFFQDMQFLWGVLSMIWNYLTPIFYPESIIPARFLTLYHMNPMYQYVTFARICIIDGVSPEPMAYLWCIVSSMAVLLIGIAAFKRHQDKFVLHL